MVMPVEGNIALTSIVLHIYIEEIHLPKKYTFWLIVKTVKYMERNSTSWLRSFVLPISSYEGRGIYGGKV